MRILSSLLFAFAVFPIVQAEVITDGSLGAKVELSGKDFQITPELGQQLGGNLFHSFQSFNLNADESATFSGANTVQNIIARVTGGQASTIDGTLRSTIPNADLYFINPYGVMFGQNAKLDLQGGFHVSTADYLKLQDGGRFDAHTPNNSLLTVAPVSSFGFLTNTPAAIQVHDSNLSIPMGKTFSLIGGDLQLHHSQLPRYDETSSLLTDARLTAPAGRIQLASVAAPSLVTPTTDGLLTNGVLGTIDLYNFLVDASGVKGGSIFIRAGLLKLIDSQIHSHTLAHLNGEAIDIQAENVSLQDSEINAITLGTGRGSDIRLRVSQDLTAIHVSRPSGLVYGFHTRGASVISTYTVGTDSQTGQGGNISIQAGNLTLLDGSGIHTRGTSPARSGNIEITVADTFQASGTRVFNEIPVVVGLNSENHGGGNSGNIHLTAQHLYLDQGAQIGTPAMGMGLGGDITIQTDTLQLTGQDKIMGIPSSIVSTSIGQAKAGKTQITTRLLTLKDGGLINTGTMHAGEGNELSVDVSETLTISGVAKIPYTQPSNGYILPSFPSSIAANSTSFGQEGGQAGHLWVRAKHIEIQEGGSIGSFTYGGGTAGDTDVIADTITLSGNQSSNGLDFHSSISSASINPAPYAGRAGNLHVQANQIYINAGAEITTGAANSGGGNLTLSAQDLLCLTQGKVTTSVFGGQGNGGNIAIQKTNFVVLNQGQIKAQADAGHGGNISLVAQHFVPSFDSLVSASSNLGIDGKITIASPTEDVGNQVLNLSASFLNASSLFPRSCAARIADQRPSQFVRPFALTVKSKAVIAAPEDLRTSHIQ